MELSTYKFTEEVAKGFFVPVFGEIKELVEEAKKRNPEKGIKKFNELFFMGGTMELQKDVRGTWKEGALMYAKALMRSYAPSHEDKELIVGMIFEECLVL